MSTGAVPPPAERVRSRRLRLAAGLVVAGLAVEAASVLAPHPACFVAFVLGSGGLVAAGAVLALVAILARSGRAGPGE